MTEDDLTRLKAHRADTPPPTVEAQRDARAALTKAIERDAARLNVPGGIVQLALRRGRPRGARWRVRIALALAFAIAVSVVAATLRPGAPDGPVAASAAQVLWRLAAVAASQPPPLNAIPKGAGEYRYTHTQSIDSTESNGKCVILEHKEVERWVAANGSGVERRREWDPEFLSEADRSRCASALSRRELNVGGRQTRYGPGCLSVSGAPVDLGKLPTEPGKLRELLETGQVEGGPPGPGEAFTQVGDLLRNSEASPRLRSALYKAAASLPGVQLIGETIDQAGRTGIGLAIVYHYVRDELIFDPRTSALLAERNTVANSRVWGGPVGAVTGEAVYWPSTIVRALPSGLGNVRTWQCKNGVMLP